MLTSADDLAKLGITSADDLAKLGITAQDDVARLLGQSEKVISKLDKIEVKFNYNNKYDEAEFA